MNLAAIVYTSLGTSGRTTSTSTFGGPYGREPFEFAFRNPAYWLVFEPGRLSFQREWVPDKLMSVVSYNGLAYPLGYGKESVSDGLWPGDALITGWWQPTGEDKYLGVYSKDPANPDNTHHGWIRLSWNRDGTATVYDYAYESTPNVPITIGATTAVPEVGTPMLFFAGLVTLFCFTRFRKISHRANDRCLDDRPKDQAQTHRVPGSHP